MNETESRATPVRAAPSEPYHTAGAVTEGYVYTQAPEPNVLLLGLLTMPLALRRRRR